MSFIFLLLLFGFFWFIILPIIRGLMAANRFRNNMQDMFNQATGNFSGNSQGEKPGRESVKRKKIDSSVGEYVEFEEVKESKSETHTSTDGSKSYKAESQIDDVEWEEIN